MKVRPWSKSFYSMMKKCAWRAYAYKVFRLKEPPREAPEQGKETHKYWQDILAGKMGVNDMGATKYPFTKSFVRKALEIEEIGTGGIQFFEPHFIITDQGLSSVTYEMGMFHGYLDRVVFFDAKENPETGWFDMSEALIYVEDLKTNASINDDITERHGYIALVKAAFPECKKFTFARLFCRKGVRQKWDYTFSDDNKSIEIFNHQKQVSENMRITSRSKVVGLPGANPLFNYLFKMDLEIQNAAPTPNPGKNCENWYGDVCFCLGKECPLAANTPAIAAEMDIKLENIDTKALLQKLISENPSEFKQWEVNTGLSGVMQLEGFVKKIRDNLKAWSKANGSIFVGDSEYAWAETETPVINAEKALTTMVLGGMDVKDIARSISINKTALSRAPKAYAELIDNILQESFVTKKAIRFGPIENSNKIMEGTINVG